MKTYICAAYPVGTDPEAMESGTAKREWFVMNQDLNKVELIARLLGDCHTCGVEIWTIWNGILYHDKR